MLLFHFSYQHSEETYSEIVHVDKPILSLENCHLITTNPYNHKVNTYHSLASCSSQRRNKIDPISQI